MGHHNAGGELGDLACHPDEEAALQPVLHGALYGLAREVPDLDEVDLFEVRQETHGGLLGEATGGEDEGFVALRTHNVDGLHDACRPCRRREGAHDAGGAEDGDTADDTEARVGRFLRDLLAAANADEYPEAA